MRTKQYLTPGNFINLMFLLSKSLYKKNHLLSRVIDHKMQYRTIHSSRKHVLTDHNEQRKYLINNSGNLPSAAAFYISNTERAPREKTTLFVRKFQYYGVNNLYLSINTPNNKDLLKNLSGAMEGSSKLMSQAQRKFSLFFLPHIHLGNDCPPRFHEISCLMAAIYFILKHPGRNHEERKTE